MGLNAIDISVLVGILLLVLMARFGGWFAMTIRVPVLVAALSVASCYESPTGPDAVLGTPFDLKAGAVAELPDDARLRFERVTSDSRCPMDAICVWAGDATIAVTLKPAKGSTESREMHTQPAGSRITYANYTVTLTGLAPYPRSSQEIRAGDYLATFVVTTPPR